MPDTRLPVAGERPQGVAWEQALEQAEQWACKLATGRPTRADAQAFRHWRDAAPLHAAAWREACQSWRDVGEMARRYEGRQQAGLVVAMPERRWMLRAGMAAGFASLAGVMVVQPPFGLWPSWREWQADYRTGKGEQRTLALQDDGVALTLNTQTRIAVERDAQAPRVHVLAGEAAISVSGQRSVVVEAGAVRTWLQGGDIELRCLDGDRVRIRCHQGAVQVTLHQQRLTLRPGHQMICSRQSLGVPEPWQPALADWREGMLVFHDLSLSQAVQEINRYRAGRVVVLAAPAARRISASFQIGALDDAINQLCIVFDLQQRSVGDVVFLT